MEDDGKIKLSDGKRELVSSETSKLYLYGHSLPRPQLCFEYLKSLPQDAQFHYILFTLVMCLFSEGVDQIIYWIQAKKEKKTE